MKNINNHLLFFLFPLAVMAACSSNKGEKDTAGNPPAAGFNEANSDPKAIEIADKVMTAMGGRKNWDDAHYICWNFFGRHLIWDKWNGDVRIDSNRDSTQYLLNINTMEGNVAIKGQEITEPDSLKKLLDRGKRIWINDSYWLLMPYKLKDSGVTLKYLREDTTQSGLESDVLGLTFENVGVTPDNKYEVWVDKESSLVRQWAYYQYDTLKEPGFITPWNNWEQHGKIRISGDRGNRALTDIMVLEQVPEGTFNSFKPVILNEVD